MILSASQFKTFQRCQRLWWFEKSVRMPSSKGSYGHAFGKVIHAVVERWLEADAAGRNLAGERKELYPDGWQTVEGTTILPADEPVVKELVNMAITEGVIQRLPDREIEKAFTVPLTPGVEVTGRIDVALPGTVIDHKSTVSMRYALSEEKLKQDTQMLLYAKIQQREGQDHVVLQHNVFDRSKVRVRKTRVEVPVEDVEDHWEYLKGVATLMKSLHDSGLTDDDMDMVPKNMPDGCNAFGGCRFIGVCTKRETPEHFRARYLRLAGEK